jgi:hypothetical protein
LLLARHHQCLPWSRSKPYRSGAGARERSRAGTGRKGKFIDDTTSWRLHPQRPKKPTGASPRVPIGVTQLPVIRVIPGQMRTHGLRVPVAVAAQPSPSGALCAGPIGWCCWQDQSRPRRVVPPRSASGAPDRAGSGGRPAGPIVDRTSCVTFVSRRRRCGRFPARLRALTCEDAQAAPA